MRRFASVNCLLINLFRFLRFEWYNGAAMSDLEFIQRFVKGDRLSRDEFLRQYSRLIYNYIHNVLDTKGYAFVQAHIQDIFQELFCSLIKDNFKKLRSFKAKNGCSLASWLRLVTINFTIDYLRKIKPAVSIDEELDDEFSLKDILSNDSTSPPDALSLEERLSALKGCIKKLDTDDKYFLELHINQGLSLKVLKGIFRVSRGVVDMRKSRILERLRDCFRSKGFKLDF